MVEVEDSITVLQWNCRSIVPKIDSFKFLIHGLQCDAFALCETWLTTNIDVSFHDFNIIRLNRDTPYGAVLLRIRSSFYRINLPSMPGIEVVACEIKIKGKDLCIASVYIPPRASVGQRQLSDIIELLPEPRLVLGDFNSHGSAWGSLYNDNRSTSIYNLCDDFNMTVLNNKDMTRIPRSPARASVLDVSLCSNSLRLDCTWKVISDPHDSYHRSFQISIANVRRSA